MLLDLGFYLFLSVLKINFEEGWFSPSGYTWGLLLALHLGIIPGRLGDHMRLYRLPRLAVCKANAGTEAGTISPVSCPSFLQVSEKHPFMDCISGDLEAVLCHSLYD